MTTSDPNVLFGELRALIQQTEGSPDGALAFFDAHALAAPRHARDVWLPYAVEHLSRKAEGLDKIDGIPISCAVASLTRWVGHDALATSAALPDGLALIGAPEPFAPFTFCASLLELFWTHGSSRLMSEARLPEELMSYLAAAQGRWWSEEPGNPYATKLYGASSIVESTRYELDCWACDRESASEGRAPGAWISIGDSRVGSRFGNRLGVGLQHGPPAAARSRSLSRSPRRDLSFITA